MAQDDVVPPDTWRFRHGGRDIEITLDTWIDHVYRPSQIGKTFVEVLASLPLEGRRLLDVGCGSGVIGIGAAKCGAIVTCVDIDEFAVRNAVHNAAQNRVDIEVLVSDGFGSVPTGQFDVIVSNCPLPDRALFDIVVGESRDYLEPNGVLVTWATSAFDFGVLETEMMKSWDCLEVRSELRYDFSRIGDPDKLRGSYAEHVLNGRLVMAAGKYFSTARWYMLWNL